MKLFTLNRPFLVLVFSLLSYSLLAQKVRLTGVVRDADKKEPIFSAGIQIEGTTTGAQTDFEGKYKLDIPANTALKLIVRSFGYTTQTISLNPIPAAENRILNFELVEEAKESKEVVVQVQRRKDTDVSMITDMRKAEMVVNGISQEQIKRSQDLDAAQAMARVPGVTIVDNRFVMIRGINERYNSVMINDAISPGTEVDTRAFSFDLIASNMIERMMIYKSGAASLPGEFAGGVVKIYTKNTVTDNFTQISIGSALRPATSFQSSYKPEGSGTDGLGFDNGVRTLPAGFPSTQVYQNLKVADQVELAKTLNSDFGTNKFSNMPDLRLGISLGRRWKVGENQMSTVSSLNYTKTYLNVQTQRYRYASWDAEKQKSQDTLFRYTDDSYCQQVRISAVSNWMYKTAKSRYEFKNLFNQIGDNETVIRNGETFDRSQDSLRSYGYHYTSRSLYSSQVLGQHTLSDRSSLDWVGSFSYTNRSEPDYRRIRTFKPQGINQPYELSVAASSGAIFETGRFHSSLKEYVGAAGATYNRTFSVKWDSAKATLRTGFYTEGKSRDYQARYFVYLLKNNSENQDLLVLPLDRIFAPENLATNKFVLEEGTRAEDGYQAQNVLVAGFAEVVLPVGKWKIIGGIRPEFNQQSLQSATATSKVDVKNPILSPLGFLNASYDISQKWVGRVAYSKTVNRPEFRELAPFVYYDFNLDANFVGNPNLKVADIHNLDARLEFYPSKGEVISFGAFYKYFINPIETKVSPIGLSPQFTYSNADKAKNYGIEVELRKSLGVVGEKRFIDRLFIVANASLIHSRVDLGVVGSQERIRALQGQSPYVVNGGFYYTDDKSGLQFSALYNVFGKRIFMVGDDLFPSIYEMPRHVVDMTVSKQIGKRYTLKAGVSDLLNYRTRFVQDSNRDGKITGNDELISSHQKGAYYTFAVIVNL